MTLISTESFRSNTGWKFLCRKNHPQKFKLNLPVHHVVVVDKYLRFHPSKPYKSPHNKVQPGTKSMTGRKPLTVDDVDVCHFSRGVC